MSSGRILVGSHDGVHVLKLTGDVRVTLGATVDGVLQDVLASDDLASVLVDLSETDGIDSTSLGLLARLSIEAQRRLGRVPTLISTRPDITRVLTTMGFDEDVFEIVEEPLDVEPSLGEQPEIDDEEAAVRARVLAAHRTLMSLSPDNRERFRDLVSALEASGDGG